MNNGGDEQVNKKAIKNERKGGINYFEEIGWLDPIGNTKPNLSVSVVNCRMEKLIYPEYQYNDFAAPYIAYRPSDRLLRSFIKACVNEKNIDRILRKFGFELKHYDPIGGETFSDCEKHDAPLSEETNE